MSQQAASERYSILILAKSSDIQNRLSDIVEKSQCIPIVMEDIEKACLYASTKTRELVSMIVDASLMADCSEDQLIHYLEKRSYLPFIFVGSSEMEAQVKSLLTNSFSCFFANPLDYQALAHSVGQMVSSRKQEIDDEKEILEGFLNEAEMLVEEIEPLISHLTEEGYDEKILDRIFAIVHTIKGASGFFEPDKVHRFSHKFEDYLSKIKNGEVKINGESAKILFSSLDYLTHFLDELKKEEYEPHDLEVITSMFTGLANATPVDSSSAKKAVDSPTNKSDSAQASSGHGPKVREDIRVSVRLLDDFLGMSGEITVLRNMINKIVKSLEKTHSGNRDILLLSELLGEMHKVNTLIQDKIVELRKVPVDSIYRPIRRVVRDLGGKLGKDLILVTEGDKLRIDTSIAEILNNSLVHMVRNCGDHGIESKERRLELGKPEAGTIKIKCQESEENIRVTIEDDGAGINLPKVESVAIKKRIVTQEDLKSMNESDRLALIFAPGFSTADQVTDVSGRGVGTDMLKSSVEKIGGQIGIKTKPGEGTQFVLDLPIPKSVLILNALFVKAGDQEYAIPRDEIMRLLRYDLGANPDPFDYLEGGVKLLNLDGELVPVVDLKQVFQLSSSSKKSQDEMNALLIQTKNMKYVLIVDEILDMEDTVVKKLDSSLGHIKGILGATFLGEGHLGLILNANQVGELAEVQFHESLVQAEAELDKVSDSMANKYILFSLKGSKAHYSISSNEVFRLESFNSRSIQWIGGLPVILYGHEPLALFGLSNLLGFNQDDSWKSEDMHTIVVKMGHSFVGFVVNRIENLVEISSEMFNNVTQLEEIKGNLIFNDKVYVNLDLEMLMLSLRNHMDFSKDEIELVAS